MMAVIVSVANQKGGVGKTTTAVNLATALAAIGKRVLLVDLDPQSNATTGLGVYSGTMNTSYDLFVRGITLSESMVCTKIPGLSLIPASIDLVGAEIELVQTNDREKILRNSIDPYISMFDYIIIDSPPSMGILTLNALVAADGVLIPLQCEYYALEGLSYLLGSIARIKSTSNPTLQVFGVVLTMFDKRSALCLSVVNDARRHLQKIVFDSVIPRNVKIAEAPSHGKPVLLHDVKSIGSMAYMTLAREFLAKERSGVWNKN
ncbi:MAG: ParA family protein [Holosporales bacterium]|jgi:chromosome partitioning protein|nr:ParA family protein [Holosporales bacterium]